MIKILLALFGMLFFQCAHAQLNQEFIQQLESELQRIEEETSPKGLSIAVKSGNDIWAGQIGVSAESEPLNDGSLLAMGSITKTFVSACILGLMEDGKLKLDDPLGKYLDTFDHVDSTITIKELLNHTSGIFNYTNHVDFFDEVFSPDFQRHSYTSQEVLEKFVSEKVFSRGERQDYSNTNYLLLGMIIEKISGRPFYEEVFERFDSPNNYPSLGMPPFTLDSYDLSNLWFDLGNGFLEDVEFYSIGLDGLFSSAYSAGAFTCNPTDLVKWGYDLYSGKLLSAAAMDSLFKPPPFQFAPGVIYGLGVTLFETGCGGVTSGHGGGILYTAELEYAEEFDLAVAVMTNDGNGILERNGVGGLAIDIVCNYGATISSVEDDLIDGSEVSVFPNPNNGSFTISLENLGSNKISYSI